VLQATRSVVASTGMTSKSSSVTAIGKLQRGAGMAGTGCDLGTVYHVIFESDEIKCPWCCRWIYVIFHVAPAATSLVQSCATST
jgi:hypothetical protein